MEVTDYPQFTKVLRDSGTITYLFGAGLSMSLGEHNKSWWHWLQAGKGFLDVGKQNEFEKQIGSGSAGKLIGAAGYLLNELKAGGKYDEFMRQEMLSIHPINTKDISALRLIDRAGDFIATTNYDTSIEQAVGIGAVTYSEPDKILALLKRKSERKVIHLHGTYIPSQGIDDIIADDTQYEKIVGNPGAQFLQEFIGINPIIIVGCGGTTDDPNMSGFLSFSSKYLNTDVPYFYLYKSGDDLTNLPDNFIRICYGNDYSGLPLFLLNVSTYRIRFHSGFERMMEINPYIELDKTASAFGRMHFLNRFNKFIGRKSELAALRDFCNDPKPVLFWSVIGEGGIGKSRLMLEYLSTLDSGWFGFFGRKGKDVYNELTPFSNTVIVFDYIAGEEEKCADAISSIISKFESSAFKLRIIFLERKIEKEKFDWFHKIQGAFDSTTRLSFDSAQYSKNPLSLGPLTIEEEKEYIASYIDTYFSLIGTDDGAVDVPSLVANAGEIEQLFREQLPPDCYRPLYLSIFTEVWIYKNGVVTVAGAKELLEEFLLKEEKRWKLILGSEEALQAYEKILAFSCAVEIFCINEADNGYLQAECECLTRTIKSIVGIGKRKNSLADLFIYEQKEDINAEVGERIIRDIVNSDSFNISEKYGYAGSYAKLLPTEELKKERRDPSYRPKTFLLIEPVYPDIIREFITDYYTDESEWADFARLARQISVFEFGRFLMKAMDDFPEEESFEAMALTTPESPSDMFEMYFTFLTSTTLLIKHPYEIADILQNSVVTYKLAPFEIETWRRLILANYYHDQYNETLECGRKFISYAMKYYRQNEVESGFCDVMEDYSGIIFEKRDLAAFADMTEAADLFYESVSSFKDNSDNMLVQIATLCSEEHQHLAMLKEFKTESYGVKKDWDKAVSYYELYPDDEDIAGAVSEISTIYMRYVTQKELFKRALNITELMARVSETVTNDKTIGKYAICLSNIYGMNAIGVKNFNANASNEERYEALAKLEELIKNYPDNQDVAMAYGTAKSDSYYDMSPDKVKITDKEANWYRKQFELHRDSVEFAESYARILGLQATHLFEAGKDREAKSILDEMRRIGRDADLHEYEDEDANIFIETADGVETIYSLKNALKGQLK